jgi:hypothetical protein
MLAKDLDVELGRSGVFSIVLLRTHVLCASGQWLQREGEPDFS